MKYMSRFKLILLIIPLLVTNIYAMLGTTGKISGRVTDGMTGEPMPFVNIILEGTTLGAASDIDGYYNIINIPPGVYTIKASAIGYNTTSIQNVKVSIDLTTNLDIQISETSIELKQDVVVVATRPMIQKDMTASTSVVGEELISELPVTEVGDILQLQAGIVSSGGGLHLRGGRSGQIAYQIDGVPVTDAYDGSNVVDVATNSIQELQVISGAFNAEYGQAMSGIVNIVTKDGDNRFSGNLQAYSGDYFSTREDIFWNIKDIDPAAIKNFEGSLSGPILRDKIFFFANARYFENIGFLYGKRTFLITDIATERPESAGSEYNVTQNGDGAYVPMNPSERMFAQGKLTARPLQGIKLTLSSIFENQEYKEYNNDARNRLTPDNNLQRFRRGYTNTLSLNHAVSPSSYYTLSASYFYKDYHHYLFEDLNNLADTTTQYVNNRIRQTPPYSFNVGGTDYSRFERSTGTYGLKLDWVNQFTQELNIQFGGEFKQHSIFMHDITLIPTTVGGKFQVEVPHPSTTNNNEYLHKPIESSAYIQSKLEAFNLIFNLGVRIDVFEPDGKVLSDPSDPTITYPRNPNNRFNDLNDNGVQDPGEASKSIDELRSYWYKDAELKYQFSPRIGLAFPITDRGVIHFSYGHFLQLPSYELLYQNPDFEIYDDTRYGVVGNADLKPQTTVKGEIGLQQQIGEDMAVDITMFFEDFRNLTGTQVNEILIYNTATGYFQFSNSDFGFSKGFIVKFEKRFGGGLSTNIDYTYSVTKGNASNPQDARNAVAGGALPETYIAPLNWDQAHTLNFSVTYTKANNYGFSLIGNFYTGQPYTPAVNKNTNISQNGFPRNSANKPSIFNLDLRAYKDFMIGASTVSLFVKVFNLLDLENPVNVYTNSGDPAFTFDYLDAQKVSSGTSYNTLQDYYTNPTYYYEPRRVEVGLSYNF